MSEKRFELGYIQSTWWKITDTQTNNVIEHNERKVTDLLNSLDNECNFLAEQRQYLKKENEQLRNENKRLEKDLQTVHNKNKELQTENLELVHMNKQLREINKDIGDDLYSCRLNKNIISEKLKLWQDILEEHNIYTLEQLDDVLSWDR